MTKKILTRLQKQNLKDYARSCEIQTSVKSELDNAVNSFNRTIVRLISKRYTDEDIKTLKKHGYISGPECTRHIVGICYRSSKQSWLIKSNKVLLPSLQGGFRLVLSKSQFDKYEQIKSLEIKHHRETGSVLGNYFDLIDSSKTLEQIAEHWPGVLEFDGSFAPRSSGASISDKSIEVIKKTNIKPAAA